MEKKPDLPAEKPIAKVTLGDAARSAEEAATSVRDTNEQVSKTQEKQKQLKAEAKDALAKGKQLDPFIKSLAQAVTINTMADTVKFNEMVANMGYQVTVRISEYYETLESVEKSVAEDEEKSRTLADIKIVVETAMQQYSEYQEKLHQANELLAKDPNAVPKEKTIEYWSYIIGGYKKLQEGLNAYDKLRGEYKHFARYFAPQAEMFDPPTGKYRNQQGAQMAWKERQRKTNDEIAKMYADYQTFVNENPDPKHDTKEIGEIRARLAHAHELFTTYQPKYAQSQDNKNITFLAKYLMESALDEYFLFAKKVKEKSEELDKTPEQIEADRKKEEERQKAEELAAAQRKIEEAQKQTPQVRSRGMAPVGQPKPKNEPTLAPPLQPKKEERVPAATSPKKEESEPLPVPAQTKEPSPYEGPELSAGKEKVLVSESGGFRRYYITKDHPAFAVAEQRSDIRAEKPDADSMAFSELQWTKVGGLPDGRWESKRIMHPAIDDDTADEIRSQLARKWPVVERPAPDASPSTIAKKEMSDRPSLPPRFAPEPIQAPAMSIPESGMPVRRELPDEPAGKADVPVRPPRAVTEPRFEAEALTVEGMISIPGKEVYVAFYLPDGSRSMDFVRLGSHEGINNVSVAGRFHASRGPNGWMMQPDPGLTGTFLIRSDGKDRQVRVRRK